jgi:hypothetical protein
LKIANFHSRVKILGWPTNEDDSHVNDLNMDKDREVGAAIQYNTIEYDSMVAPPLCTIFSDDDVDTVGNTLSCSLLVDAGSRLAIYFQNVNRLQSYVRGRLRRHCFIGNDFTTRNCSMQDILFSDVVADF